MHVETARWTREALSKLDLEPGARALDVGSSTLHYRTVEQAYIEQDVMAPLRDRGVEITHLDAKQDPGVDFVCNLDRADESVISELGTFDLVLALGVIQCVGRPEHAFDLVARAVAPGGWLVVHHPETARRTFDPRDNMLRKKPHELVAMLERRGLERVRAESVRIGEARYYKDFVSRPSWIPVFGRFWFPMPGFTDQLRRRVPRLRWRQSVVIARRPAGAATSS